ncbi:putative nuclease HARBI1 [Pleurodeles waltl]|uniref:putative nuclease HARBI1 n=1 Tax=Pleurodeles waltl TaxID=8319 RepID=UPI003709770A
MVDLATLEERHIIQFYQLNPQTIMDLVRLLEPDLHPGIHHCNAIKPTVQVLSVLHFLASGSSHITVGWAAGMSLPMLSNVLKNILCALLKYIGSHIRFPQRDDLPTVKAAFYAVTKTLHHFPDFHTVSNMPITSVYIGDSGYPNLPWPLTPLRHPTTATEDCFTEAHGRTQQVIERTFGVLKARFRCLHFTGGALLYRPAKVCQIIVACCMLQNLAIRRHISLLDAKEGAAVPMDDEGDMGSDEEDDDKDAADFRAELIQQYSH